MVLTELERKERRRESKQKYYNKNKEKNKERSRESSHKYYHENKEKVAQQKKAYDKTEKGKRLQKIRVWKSSGVICENFDNLYDYYINCKNCEACGVELTVDRYNTPTTRCLDHCHKTGEFRDVLCNLCNVKRK